MTRFALVLAACGQMYQQPGAAPPAEPLPASQPIAAPARAHAPRGPESSPPAGQGTAPGASAERPFGSTATRWVAAHNQLRAKHCAKPLAWSEELAAVAQRWADTLRDRGCKFGHSPGAKYGENLAAGTQGALDPESTVRMWYDEIARYKFPDGGFSLETGHFTQVVWRSTRLVGCGHATCKGNDIYVCNYDPPGNWEGQYRREVLPTGCKP